VNKRLEAFANEFRQGRSGPDDISAAANQAISVLQGRGIEMDADGMLTLGVSFVGIFKAMTIPEDPTTEDVQAAKTLLAVLVDSLWENVKIHDSASPNPKRYMQ